MISNKEIKHIMLDLIETFGLPKDPVDETELRYLFEAKRYGKLVSRLKAIAGLDVDKIKVLMEKDLSRFSNGRNSPIGMIQIPIGNPPKFGTRRYKTYPWTLRLLSDSKDDFDTFVSVVMHEFSHILLHSKMHKRRHSEEATDLMVHMIGFGEIYVRAHYIYLRRGQHIGYLSKRNVIVAKNTVNFFKGKGVTGPNQAYASLGKKQESKNISSSIFESVLDWLDDLLGP